MKNFSLIYKIKTEKNCEKRSGGTSVNDICFKEIKFFKLLPSSKSVNPLLRGYLKTIPQFYYMRSSDGRGLPHLCGIFSKSL